jgi:hypothetical protein
MKSPSAIWTALFEPRRAGDFEPLLWFLLLNAMRKGLSAVIASSDAFHTQDAFHTPTIAVNPVGWAAGLPVDLVLSQDFERAVGLVVFVFAALWLFKRWLLVSPALCAASHGLLISLELSRMFNYAHQNLISVWSLIVLALVYQLRRQNTRAPGRSARNPIMVTYPAWAGVLIGAFLGFQYTYSGINKLLMGGIDADNGLNLQLLVYQVNNWGETLQSNWAAQFFVDHRSLAAIAMTSAVILETGAVAAFLVSRLRPWWALGLASMHVSVMLTMHISFATNTIVLVWLAIPPGLVSRAIEMFWQSSHRWFGLANLKTLAPQSEEH